MDAPSTENEPKNCWEFMKCPKVTREKCVSYTMNSGNECWLIINVEKGCPAHKAKGGCFTCPWFKKKNP